MSETLDRLNINYFFCRVLRKKFDRFLNEFGFHSTQFMPYLKKMNSVIAGGFALSCFTGELYDTSDIDIYIPSSTIEHFQIKLKKSKFEKYLLRNGYEKTTSHDISSQELYDNIYYEFENKNTKRKIQIIYHFYDEHSAPLSVGQSVIYDFDFTTVMCFIKQCKNRSNKLQFNCYHLNDVLNKKIRLNPMCPKLHTEEESLKLKRLKRCLKYKTKGYRLSVSMDILVPMITEDFKQYEKTMKDTV
jgi:hypothetical protein